MSNDALIILLAAGAAVYLLNRRQAAPVQVQASTTPTQSASALPNPWNAKDWAAIAIAAIPAGWSAIEKEL